MMEPPRSAADEGLPALFWDTIPEDAEEHADYAGIQALIHDESTPDETAENFKNQGNKRLARARLVDNNTYLRDALEFYTKGLNVKGVNSDLRSVLFSNRAQAHIYLGNWRKALEDSKQATSIKASNIKAYYRGARGALKLKNTEEALRLCKDGLKVDSSNTDLQKLMKECMKQKIDLDQTLAEEEAKRGAILAAATQLTDHMLRRGVRLCQTNFKIGDLQPGVDEEDILHWPMLFVYPETMQQDIIQDVAEIDTLEEHLDLMFGPDVEPIAWDKDGEYRRDTIIIYYLANAGRPFTRDQMIEVLAGQYSGDISEHAPTKYGEHAVAWVEVEDWKTVRDIVEEPGHIVPGVPTFFVLAKGSKYHEIFLASDQISFQ